MRDLFFDYADSHTDVLDKEPSYIMSLHELERMLQLVYEELVDASVLPVPSCSALERHVKSALQQLNKKPL